MILHCCHVSSSAAVWVAMRGVCRAWNDSLRTLPGAVWKEWALQRFHRLGLMARQLQPQADLDWKRMYQQQLEADRRGVPDMAHVSNRSLDQFIFTVEIWSGPATSRTLAFEWAGRLQVPYVGNPHAHFLQLWDPDQPPTGAWIALINDMPDPDDDDEVHSEFEARATALDVALSLWVSREDEDRNSKFIRTVQLVDSLPHPLEFAENPGGESVFDYADLPNVLLGNVGDYSGVDVDEDREEGYSCRPWLNSMTGVLSKFIRDAELDDITNDQLRFYLNHCVPWEPRGSDSVKSLRENRTN